MTKYVYDFDEGDKDQKDLLGGKGANLAEMTNLGIPVPAGFTITTEACKEYLHSGNESAEMQSQVLAGLAKIEKTMGKKLGAPDDPLLISVRSGAKFSMPGMMETVLNIGLNDRSVEGIARQSGSERFAWDSYRRLLQMFGKTVLDIDGKLFDEALEKVKSERGTTADLDLTADDFKDLIGRYKLIIREQTGAEFPQDPREQL
ncbi:MAG: PEP/pyruvate-binding domain-containing protein, partial [Frankiaceae bacterium]